MSTLETGTIEPQSGTTVTLGASGDAVVIGADALKVNTVKDAGANTIFTSDGSGTLSSVNSGLAGNMVFISSTTASGATSVTFSSGIDSTYDEYVFHFVNINPSSDGGFFQFQAVPVVNATTTFFVAAHDEGDTWGSLDYNASYDRVDDNRYLWLTSDIGSDADQSGSGILHIFGPSSTTYVKHWYATSQIVSKNDYSKNSYTAGYFNTTSAITGFIFHIGDTGPTGTFDGTIALYGIK